VERSASPSEPVAWTSRALVIITIPNTNSPTAMAASGAVGLTNARAPAVKRFGVRPRRARNLTSAAIRNA
jgi:hypothetical protein